MLLNTLVIVMFKITPHFAKPYSTNWNNTSESVADLEGPSQLRPPLLGDGLTRRHGTPDEMNEMKNGLLRIAAQCWIVHETLKH